MYVEVLDQNGGVASTASLNWVGGIPAGINASFDDGGTPGLFADDQIIVTVRSNTVVGTTTINITSNPGGGAEVALSQTVMPLPYLQFIFAWAPVGLHVQMAA